MKKSGNLESTQKKWVLLNLDTCELGKKKEYLWMKLGNFNCLQELIASFTVFIAIDSFKTNKSEWEVSVQSPVK